MIQSQQYSLPLVLESVNEQAQTISTHRRNVSQHNEMKQRTTTLNLSKSFHQDLTTNESEEDLLLNYSEIQQYILKESNSRNKKYPQIQRNIINLNDSSSNVQSKYLSKAFYSRQRVIKSQNKFQSESTYLSQTPTKYQNVNVSDVISQTQNSVMRRTVTAAHPSELSYTLNERMHTLRGGFGVNYSISKIKSSMKQQKEFAKTRSFTIQDSFAIEGKNSVRDKSFDQHLNQSQFPLSVDKELEKKKKVVYSKKPTSVVLSQSSILEKLRQTDQYNFKKKDISNSNGNLNNDISCLGLQIDTTIKNFQGSQSTSPKINGSDTPSFQINQMPPIIFDYRPQRFKPRKQMQSPYRKQNIKQREDSIDLQSNHQQNYLALFPIKNSKPIDSPIKLDIKDMAESCINTDNSVKQLLSQTQVQQVKPLKQKIQKFEFIHMNDFSPNMALQQAPSFQKNETLNRFYPKTFTQQKLKPLKIYDIN